MTSQPAPPPRNPKLTPPLGTMSDRPINAISRRDLYVNLAARVAYLQSFLDFSQRDIDALVSGSKYIKQLIPAVVNIVYKKLLTYDITARAFTTRSTSYEGPIAEVVEEAERVARS